MKKKSLWTNKWFWFAVIYFGISIYLGMHVEPDMSHVGADPHKITHIGDFEIPMGGVNKETIFPTWGIMAFLIIISFIITRRLKEVPGRVQLIFELLIGAFDQLCRETLGDKGRKFLPYVATIFIFVCLSNWISFVPLGIHEPTKDLNTTLGLGVIAFFVSHLAAIRYKGIIAYIADYFQPMIEVKGIKIPNVIFAPLNVVGELGKLISHSFRLYGNILGGVIIIEVVSALTRYVVLPIGLNFFFVLFVGLVQAFVFAMLALTYIAVLVEE